MWRPSRSKTLLLVCGGDGVELRGCGYGGGGSVGLCPQCVCGWCTWRLGLPRFHDSREICSEYARHPFTNDVPFGKTESTESGKGGWYVH
jgi:hypothetical protein